MSPKIYILVPVHNRIETTRKFVALLKNQTIRNLRLVLIDDGSTDGTSEMVTTLLPESTILKGDGNLWWGGSLQKGYEWLIEENLPDPTPILIINDDTTFGPDFLANALKVLTSSPKKLLLARARNEKGELIENGVMIHWGRLRFEALKDDREMNCASTRGLFLRLGDLRRIGGFHPILLPHYLSDYEFSIRAIRKGFSIGTDPSVELTMDETLSGIRSTGKGSIWSRIHRLFSKRSALNPFYTSVFLVYSCPWYYLPWNIGRVWLRSFVALALGK